MMNIREEYIKYFENKGHRQIPSRKIGALPPPIPPVS